MSQRFSLYLDLTVRENITLLRRRLRPLPREAGERLEWVAEMAGLRGREDSLTGALAGGWRQRLALGCAVLHDPPILFLDEPTAGVDPLSRRDFWELINRLADAGTTVLVTTHYLDEAEYCNRVLLMHAGRLVAEGSPAQLKERTFPDRAGSPEGRCRPWRRSSSGSSRRGGHESAPVGGDEEGAAPDLARPAHPRGAAARAGVPAGHVRLRHQPRRPPRPHGRVRRGGQRGEPGLAGRVSAIRRTSI